MNILITGATGFLGGRIVQHLVALGHDVTLAIRTKTDLTPWANGSKQQLLDWQDRLSIERCCLGKDIIIHAAGMNSQDCAADPAAAIEFNGAFTARLAYAAERTRVSKFFFLSTAHVYNEVLKGVITETTCAVNQHPYAFSKRAGESALLHMHRQGKMNVAILRLSNIIGAPAHTGVNTWMLLVNDICRQAVMTQKIVLHTPGQQLRDFLGMNSFLSILNNILDFDLTKYSDPIFNIGSRKSISVLQMSMLVKEYCEVLFSTPVEIVLPSPTAKDHILLDPFLFSTHYPEIGYGVSGDYAAEIQELLLFCKKNYNHSK